MRAIVALITGFAILLLASGVRAQEREEKKVERTETPYSNEHVREIRKEKEIAREVERQSRDRYYRFRRTGRQEN